MFFSKPSAHCRNFEIRNNNNCDLKLNKCIDWQLNYVNCVHPGPRFSKEVVFFFLLSHKSPLQKRRSRTFLEKDLATIIRCMKRTRKWGRCRKKAFFYLWWQGLKKKGQFINFPCVLLLFSFHFSFSLSVLFSFSSFFSPPHLHYFYFSFSHNNS